MNTFYCQIAVAPATGGRFEEVEALVDSGASYTLLPRPILEGLGIVAEEKEVFTLADGRTVEYPIAQVRVRLQGRTRFTICVFGEEGAEPLLGAVTLEEFGLAVDPVNKRLVPARRFLLAVTRS